MDTKDIEKLQIYNFIDVTHIFHKLFKALVTLRLTLHVPAYATRILIWPLFLVFFWAWKDKRIVEMSSHCSRFAKLHFHLPFQ